MSEIQVEVCFTDKLESVRVGGKPMEIPKAVKAKPVEEWFEPAAGRVKWGGLGAEIKEMDFNEEKNAAYSFLFNGPEDKKQEFMACVERFCLGEEAQQETKKKTVQDYLQEAKKNQQAGNAEMAFQQYMIAARDYGHPEAQFEVARCYQNGMGVEKNEENAVVWYKKAAEQGNAEAQCALGECYYQARGVEKDDKEARRWYEAAATQGNVTARYMTGRLYAALSYNVAAVKWYTKAAEQECPEHRRLHGRKQLVGYQPLCHRADRHFAQHLRWDVAWNIGHHQPAGEPRHNRHPRHGPYPAGRAVQQIGGRIAGTH